MIRLIVVMVSRNSVDIDVLIRFLIFLSRLLLFRFIMLNLSRMVVSMIMVECLSVK